MEFNRIIKLLRKERGITQKQAAEDLGVSQALLSHYEKGIRECGLDFVVRVADYYNVSCDYLLGRSAERNGMMLTADDLPNPDKMKDNVYHGSVLPTMNKKLISNSLNVLYAKVGQCHSKALTTEVSAYLMMAVSKMFRLLYSAEPHNAPGLFGIEQLPLAGVFGRSDACGGSQCGKSAGRAGSGRCRRAEGPLLHDHDHREPEPGVSPVYAQSAQPHQDQRDPGQRLDQPVTRLDKKKTIPAFCQGRGCAWAPVRQRRSREEELQC